MKNWILIFFVLSSQLLFAKEEVALQLERMHYASGEELKGLLAFSPKMNLQNKMICIKIFNGNNIEILNSYVKTQLPNNAAFSIKIPHQTQTGNYVIRCYYGLENKAYMLVEGGFLLQNVFQNAISEIPNFSETFSEFQKVKQQTFPSLESEKVNQHIVDTDGVGNEYGFFKGNYDETHVKNWDEKIFVFGTIKSSGEAKKVSIIGVYSSGLDKFLLTSATIDGYFYFNFPDFGGEQTFQLFPYFKDYVDFELVKKNSGIIAFAETNSGDYERQFFDKSKKIIVLNTYFNDSTYKYVQNRISTPPFVSKGYKRMDPKAYTKFDKITDLFREVDAFLKFNENKGKWSASFQFPELLVKGFDVNGDAPIFIVDGIATQNVEEIVKLKLKELETIDLYFDLEKVKNQYPLFCQQGIVWIKTKSKPEVLSEKEKNRIFKVSGFHSESNNSPKMPIGFSTFWNPLNFQSSRVSTKKIGSYPQTKIELFYNVANGFFVKKSDIIENK